MTDKYFEMKNLAVGYNGKALIRDICIDIKRGEIVTLIGPNGAGKSTILKSISKQLEIIGGSVVFDGSSIRSMGYKKLASQMALVLTERLKVELMTCHDIVATGRYPYTGRLGILSQEDEEKVDRALETVHAQELGSRDFTAISDGQKQRVLLARAICQEPDVIILDEPTSFLDVRHKLELLAILRNMAKERNITVIMSLHEIDLASKISDKIICVKGETIFDYGLPEDIFEEEKIRKLYEIDNGFFDPLYGSIELPKAGGKAETLVISSGGRGIKVYRQLQKENKAFVAGILYPGDTDYQLARLLAEEIIEEKAFCAISDETYSKALSKVNECSEVILAGVDIGDYNLRIRDLIEAAEKQGKLTVL